MNDLSLLKKVIKVLFGGSDFDTLVSELKEEQRKMLMEVFRCHLKDSSERETCTPLAILREISSHCQQLVELLLK